MCSFKWRIRFNYLLISKIIFLKKMFFDFENPIFDDEDENIQVVPAQVRIFRPRKYFDMENFFERFRLNRDQFEQFLQIIGPMV